MSEETITPDRRKRKNVIAAAAVVAASIGGALAGHAVGNSESNSDRITDNAIEILNYDSDPQLSDVAADEATRRIAEREGMRVAVGTTVVATLSDGSSYPIENPIIQEVYDDKANDGKGEWTTAYLGRTEGTDGSELKYLDGFSSKDADVRSIEANSSVNASEVTAVLGGSFIEADVPGLTDGEFPNSVGVEKIVNGDPSLSDTYSDGGIGIMYFKPAAEPNVG